MEHRTTILLAVVALLSLATPAWAQVVRGTVVDELAQRPLANAIVALHNATGERQAAVYTDAAGRFVMRAPSSGRYTIKVLRIGYRPWDGAPFEVRRADIEIPAVTMRAIQHWLDTVYVNGSDECLVRPKEGTAAGAIWNAARLVLTGALASQEDTAVALEFERYSEIVSMAGEAITLPKTVIKTTGARPPRASATAQTFASQGYLLRGLYHGPDAEVLLHDSFSASHCFRAPTRIDDNDDLVILKFEPRRARRLVDIKGELAFDRKTGALRDMIFKYVGPQVPTNMDIYGGRLEFGQLPTGRWIVRNWELRYPYSGIVPMVGQPVRRVDGFRVDGVRMLDKVPPP